METWTHPEIDADVDYAFAQRTRWTSLVYAAAAVQYAQLIKPFDNALYQLYRKSAERAYQFGIDPQNRLIDIEVHGKANRGTGDAFSIRWTKEDHLSYPYLCHAKLRLYLLTKDTEYLADLEAISKDAHKPFSHRFSHRDWSAWIYYDIVNSDLKERLAPEFVEYWKDLFLHGPPVGSGTNGLAFVGENLIETTERCPIEIRCH